MKPFFLSRTFNSPLTAGAFVFALDFGAIAAIRAVQGLGLTPRLSYKLGDGVFLPLYAALVWFVLRNYQPQGHAWESARFRNGILIAGWIAGLAVHTTEVQRGIKTWEELAPDQLYHMLIFGPMVRILGETLIPLVWKKPENQNEVIARALAILAVLGYFYSGYLDEALGNTGPFD